jgi:CheY-like chemotaxis protein
VAVERLHLIGKLRKADRRKDEFLAMLAHELRNPLAPVMHMLELVTGNDDDASLRQTAHRVMDRQLRHLVRLVDDLLDMSRITRDKLRLRREHLELVPVLQQAIETSRPMIEAANQRLSLELPDGPIVLYGDHVRLTQLFGNLINNASKYTESGGTISVTVERTAADVTVAIKDSGIGIAPETLPYVFDMFTQGNPTLERSQGGLGIGLSLVKRLADLHGGSVQAMSQGLGHGSEFVVRLPVFSHTEPEARATASTSPRSTNSKRILVVDDNRDSAASLALLLKVKGHVTQVAHDGVGAVHAAESFLPEIVLLDIGLPGMNGYDACRTIRSKPWGTGMYLVAVTGWGQPDDRMQSQNAGFDSHLVKPVTFDALSRVIRTADLRATVSGVMQSQQMQSRDQA